MSCPICKIPILKEDLEDHLDMCQNRTDHCPYCDLQVMKKEYDDHIKMCEEMFH